MLKTAAQGTLCHTGSAGQEQIPGMRTARHIQEASFAGLITDQVWERMILKRNPHFIAKSPVRDDTLIQAAVFPFRYRVGLSGIYNDQIARGGLVYPALDVDPDCTPDRTCV